MFPELEQDMGGGLFSVRWSRVLRRHPFPQDLVRLGAKRLGRLLCRYGRRRKVFLEEAEEVVGWAIETVGITVEEQAVRMELVLFMAKRVAGSEAGGLAEEAEAWIRTNVGPDYRWPGNYRELEQCVRNLVVRHQYRRGQNRRGSASGYYTR